MADPELHLGGDGDPDGFGGAGRAGDPFARQYAEIAERVAALSMPPSLHRLQARGLARRRRRLVAGSTCASLVAVLGVWVGTATLGASPAVRATSPAASTSRSAHGPTGGDGSATGAVGPSPGLSGSSAPIFSGSGSGSAITPSLVTATTPGAGSTGPTGTTGPTGPAGSGPVGTTGGPGGTTAPTGTTGGPGGSGAPTGSTTRPPTSSHSTHPTSPTTSRPVTTTTTHTTPPPSATVTVPVTGPAPFLGCRPIVSVTRTVVSHDVVTAMRETLKGASAADVAAGLNSPFSPAAAAAATVTLQSGVLIVNFADTSGINGVPTCRSLETQAMLYQVGAAYGVAVNLQIGGSQLLWGLWALGL